MLKFYLSRYLVIYAYYLCITKPIFFVFKIVEQSFIISYSTTSMKIRQRAFLSLSNNTKLIQMIKLLYYIHIHVYCMIETYDQNFIKKT